MFISTIVNPTGHILDTYIIEIFQKKLGTKKTT